jgi:CSLREA domain-containing protein
MKITSLLILVLLSSITSGYAANCRVTKTADTNDGSCTAGDCSLREAVAEPSCSLIDFSLDLVQQPIAVNLGDIVTDLQGSARHAFTSSLGWFTFDQLPANGVYKISISSKRYNAPQKTIFADHDLTDADIIVTPAGEGAKGMSH